MSLTFSSKPLNATRYSVVMQPFVSKLPMADTVVVSPGSLLLVNYRLIKGGRESVPDITKAQHYVPRFYLKRFADKDGFLHIYDRKKKNCFKRRPENICQETFLYETKWKNADKKLGKYIFLNSIERSYSKKEAQYVKLIAGLLKRCTENQKRTALICSREEKKLLVEFAVNLYVRNPWTIETFSLNQISEDVRENPIFQAAQGLFSSLNLGNIDSLAIDAQKKTFMLKDGFCEELAERLRNVELYFFYSPDAAFATSSFPSGLREDSSIAGSEKICAFLPLSPTVAVLFGNYENLHNHRNRILPIGKEDAIGFDRFYMREPKEKTQFVICQNDLLLGELIQQEKGN